MNCAECNGENYILNGCCNGRECGCLGQPVSFTNCKTCNPNDDKPMSDEIEQYAIHIEKV